MTLTAGTNAMTSLQSVRYSTNDLYSLVNFIRGTNYPVRLSCMPSAYVLSKTQTNLPTDKYTATYNAQFLSVVSNSVYPFITDTGGLLGTNRPVTKEWLTNTAMLYVPDMIIAADVDRDGSVTATNRNDRTATNNPFVFWINDDVDSGSDDSATDLDPSQNTINSTTPQIDNLRDLEDFARLQFRIEGLPTQLFNAAGLQTRIYLTNLTGAPSLRLFSAAETSGGIGYLTNTTTGNNQLIKTAYGVLSSGAPLTLANTEWQTIATNRFFLPFIFEGVTTGSCAITFVIASNSGPVVAVSRPFYLNLRSVTNLYEHWTVGDNNDTEWDSIPSVAVRTADSAVFGKPQRAEDLDYILFVHGWRMQPWERRAFASTAYKRLWHLGYRGRFGLFSWPTDYTDTDILSLALNLRNYDRSERRAWASGIRLRILLQQINMNESIRLLAHSMGNIVASEALRTQGQNRPRALVQTYVASQAASVAHAYDAVGPETTYPRDTPNVYRLFPRGTTNETYFKNMNRAVALDPRTLRPATINFHNQQDYALTDTYVWPLNQSSKWVINGVDYYPITDLWAGYPSEHPYEVPEDAYVIFSYLAPAWSKALGAAEDSTHQVRGEIGSAVDLNAAPFNYHHNNYEHSAEFRSINMNRRSYWWQLLDTCSLTNSLPRP